MFHWWMGEGANPSSLIIKWNDDMSDTKLRITGKNEKDLLQKDLSKDEAKALIAEMSAEFGWNKWRIPQKARKSSYSSKKTYIINVNYQIIHYLCSRFCHFVQNSQHIIENLDKKQW